MPTFFHVDTTSSTQDEARSRFAGDPVIYAAAAQTSGRGRQGRAWDTADRALAVSVAFAPSWPPASRPRLALVAGLAARTVLPGDCDLKWPNDLERAGRKIGGILVEAAHAIVVVGLGVNLWWPDAPSPAGALYAADPGPEPGPRLAEAFGEELLRRVEAGPDHWGRDEYLAACTTIGTTITWKPDGRGRAVDVAGDGALIVETSAGRVALRTGEVWAVRSERGSAHT